MLTEAVILSLVVALLRKGSLVRLANVPLKGVWAIFLGSALRIGVLIFALRGFGPAEAAGPYLQISVFIILLIVLFVNRRLPGLKLAGIGIMLNLMVIMLNGGQMPVDLVAAEAIGLGDLSLALESGSYATHCVLSNTTVLPFLADVIAVPPPYPTPRMISLGDIFLGVGVFIFIQWAMVNRLQDKKQ